jgi:hypothetical protein
LVSGWQRARVIATLWMGGVDLAVAAAVQAMAVGLA